MFEFSRFYPTDYRHGRDFVADLDALLSRIPKGWPYGIEIRNAHWLRPEYFECLARHRVAHVFNSWTDTSPVKMALHGSFTNSSLVAARFLLKPGRKHEEAKKSFQPYNETKEVYPAAGTAAAGLIRELLMITKCSCTRIIGLKGTH